MLLHISEDSKFIAYFYNTEFYAPSTSTVSIQALLASHKSENKTSLKQQNIIVHLSPADD
jgi:hypothetical protein